MGQSKHPAADRQTAWREDHALLREPPRPALLPALNYLPCANAVAAAVIALLVLVGWWLNSPVLQSVLPLSATMKVNTALGILACSVALFLRSNRRLRTAKLQWLAPSLAVFAILIALAAIFEHATGRSLGVNELLMRDKGSQVATVQRGLMSINSAICLTCLGFALLLFHRPEERSYLPIRIIVAVPLLISLLALAEHVTGAQVLTGVANYTPMALHTTIAFLLLSVGVLFSHRDRGLVRIVSSDTIGGALARRFLFAALSLPLLLGALVSVGLHRGIYPWDFAAALLITSFIGLFALLIWANVRELERIDLSRQAAQETRALLDSILTTAPIGFSFIDRQLRIRRMNALMADALGVSVADVLGQPLQKVAPEFAAWQLPSLRAVLTTQEPILNREERSWRTETVENKRYWLSSYYPVRDARGKVIGVSTLHIDITEQKRHEEEREHLLTAEMIARSGVEAANARLRALAQATSELASSLDYETTLLTTARSIAASVGEYCVIDLIQSNGSVRRVAMVASDPNQERLLQRCLPFPPNPASESPLAKVLRTGTPLLASSISETWLSTLARTPEHWEALRELRPRSAMVVPLEVRNRRLGIMSIITSDPAMHFSEDDFMLAQELARRAAVAIDNAELYRQAQTAIQARDDMLAVVSHDLRNPLAAIDTSTSMIIRHTPETTEGERLRRHATTIQRSSRRMQHLIKDLLDASALEYGTLSVEREAWSTTTLLQEAAELAESLAGGRGLDLVVEQEDIEGLVVDCDRERVLQVLSNLLGNATKFTPEGGTVILRAQRDVGGVRIDVQDTGPGIRPEELPHLFDRYWKGRATGVKGTGLGLYIAQGVVRLHGSDLQVDSRPGCGARFSFTLPLATEATRAPVFH